MTNAAGFSERIDAWCASRHWHWRALLLLFLVQQAVQPFRSDESFSIFSGVTFGAHEFGHLFFALSGSEWLTVAGGSLMQLIVPIGAAVAIGFTARDWFGVAACGTWLSFSLAGLANYIGDARAMELDLVSMSPDASGHDWNYLLAHAGMLRRDLAFARDARVLAGLVLFASVIFSIWLFMRMATLPAPDVAIAAE